MSEVTNQTSLAMAALKGRCPRCGEGSLFDGFLTIAERCDACGLQFAGHDTGDGPAFFIMLPLCLLVAGAALLFELAFAPQIWVHAVIWPVVIGVLVGVTLRPVKALMVALQYRHRDVEHYDPSNQQ